LQSWSAAGRRKREKEIDMLRRYSGSHM